MTLNQIVERIRLISIAHKQVRNFYFGLPSDFLKDKTTKYASSFLQDAPGVIDITGKQITFGFKLFLLDLVHVSQDAKANELDVQSDMTSVALDLMAEMNHSSYNDWKVSISNPLTLVREEFDDLVAGAVVDFSVSVPYPLDTCVVPTETLPDPGLIIPEDMKLIYDMEYVATGSEGSSFVPPAAVGKKIVLIVRENNPLHKVSNLPDPAEYTWDNASVGLGTPISVAGERFLILYRNY